MLVLKYIVPDYPFPTLYFGVANVVANGLIMLRYVYLVFRPTVSLTAPQLCGALGFAKYGGRLYLQLGPLIEEPRPNFLYNTDRSIQKIAYSASTK